ncbi:L-cystatin [Aphelenchoides besseyi]|nr:L-cystatin [Aphelenchoides besseyi]KAI6194614.1 L-cystatin [Aphelenchoides besseyi]
MTFNQFNERAVRLFVMKTLTFLFCLMAICWIASAQMPGAPVEQNDTDSTDIKRIAEQAVEEYNKRSNDLYPYVLIKIIGVKTQVVSGVSYELRLQIAQNKNCRKGNVCSSNEPTEAPKEIAANVLSQPWKQNKPQVSFPSV